ncbi:MAG: succinate dehydrogenase, cytochrome b556 subunit [Candidatus Muproteobacteria bacterium RBG_16_64_11]|uniref:Succinate dehydrogenase cytochrome b556 subunit n=1 Tax=Candidatus Muproteobacteria bacterium RBG_16_64_11 TaxID=1817758 RepID=A0A1F6T9I9_9PROT|nr:MAG: succinate dehydrogenase, cytochrome b556 subunit [Candidatus Muproteobacteria bacterium RBG_16_64_11]
MPNNKHRPVYLNLFAIHLPITGLVSVLHRVTGVLAMLLVPAALALLQRSLEGESGYAQARALIGSPAGRLAAVVTIWLMAQHFFSGLRHLLLDLDVGVTLAWARRSAAAVFLASAAVTLLAAWRLL